MTTGTTTRSGTGRPHPRVAQRRSDIRRRRRLRVTVATATLFTVAGGAWLLAQSSLLDVDRVVVRGAERVSADDVRRVAAVEVGEPLLLVDRGAVAARIERLPWVADVHVRRRWPGSLVVEVTERRPVAWIALGRRPDGTPLQLALVDGERRVLEVRSQVPERLVELRVVGEVPEAGGTVSGADGAIAIAAAMPSSLRDQVRAVQEVAGGFQIAVESAEVVRFGPATEVVRKWSALEAVLEDLAGRRVYLVDLRVPAVPAVRENETLPAPPPPPALESEAGESVTTASH